MRFDERLIDKMLEKMRFLVFNGSLVNEMSLFFARVAELVDALDLGSSGVTRESSSLSSRTTTCELYN